jgi:hypothetical protein
MKTKLIKQRNLVRRVCSRAAMLVFCLGAAPGALAASPYAGIYSGSFSGSENGIFAAFVGDDGASVLEGYSQTHYDGFYNTFTVNQNGGFSFSSNGSTANGTISGNSISGSYSGSGGGGTISGTKLPSTGIQQVNAGFYEGGISGMDSGPLKVIVAADGTAAFYVDAYGGGTDGGIGTIDTGGQFSTTTVNGTAVSGSVNSTTHALSGNWSGGGYSGTFSATRTRTFTSVSTPWPDATDLGGGKKRSGWFGDFNDTFYPWIYHSQHGWMYTYGTDPASIWFWAPDMGFLWTGSGVYPWLWSDTKQTWLYYVKDSSSPRYFFNWNTQQWETHNP